jgi:Protein of unknown function (DUF2852)
MTNHMHAARHDGDYFWWAKTPGFHPLKLVTVILGFAIFPPLGVAALLYFLWMGRSAWGGQRHGFGRVERCGRGRGRMGNEAFEEHQAKIRKDLEDERRAFHVHRAEERRKRDQEAYEAFRAAQAKPADGAH